MKIWIKLGVIILGVIVFGVMTYQLYMNSYVPYVPLAYSNRHGFVEEPMINTPEHQSNIKRVFENHGVKWRMKNGRLMIQRKMLIGIENQELLYNLEIKANGNEMIHKN